MTGGGVVVPRTTAALKSRESTPTTRLANLFTGKRHLPRRSPSSAFLVTRCVTRGVTWRSHGRCHEQGRTVVELDASRAAEAATRRPSVVVAEKRLAIDCELRDHGEYGWECQFLYEDELADGRRWMNRE